MSELKQSIMPGLPGGVPSSPATAARVGSARREPRASKARCLTRRTFDLTAGWILLSFLTVGGWFAFEFVFLWK